MFAVLIDFTTSDATFKCRINQWISKDKPNALWCDDLCCKNRLKLIYDYGSTDGDSYGDTVSRNDFWVICFPVSMPLVSFHNTVSSFWSCLFLIMLSVHSGEILVKPILWVFKKQVLFLFWHCDNSLFFSWDCIDGAVFSGPVENKLFL